MIHQSIKYGKNYAAIEHAENGFFSILQLTQKNKEFVVTQKNITKNLENGIEFLKGQKHLFLVLNDEKVLSKKILSTNSDEKILIRNAFPNISLSDFYYQVYQNTNYSFVCIARRDSIDHLLNYYSQKGISVIDFSLGNLVIQNLQPFIENKKLFSSNAQIEFDNNSISDIKKINTSNENYLINDLEVSNIEILPLAGIISYYIKNASSVISKELKQKYFHKRFFDVGLKVGLGFLLILLLGNFFFFSSYRDKVNDFTGELQLRESYKSQLNKLQEEVTQKKRLVESVQSASNSKLSQYIDELGSSTPNTTLLSQVFFQPIEGVQKKEKELLFNPNQIIVKGVSKENEGFSDWISFLEQKKWIKKISIHTYGKGKEARSTSTFEFIITTDD
ncbi:hypothetical protein [Polaribacter sp. Asnod1-A03]|uniref:hypothetical protein n=1 Tax=Polaribacter sp. Asnod1-A03 TaxID=3160581 RepID=UPI00386759A5